MAGGAGERFWPLSRKSKPKHLWNVVGGDACLLSMTYSRAREAVGGENIFVVTNPEQVEAITLACPEIARDKILVEPAGRDTTAAIGFSAAYLKRISGGKDCSFAVLPSDHIVGRTGIFGDAWRSLPPRRKRRQSRHDRHNSDIPRHGVWIYPQGRKIWRRRIL